MFFNTFMFVYPFMSPLLCSFLECPSDVLIISSHRRNLRIREDTAKYLLNLDVNSAYYDPKTRSMREDPLPDADPNDKFYVVSI